MVQLVTAALYKHEIIFTDAHTHHLEQWVELIARYYLYDRTTAERRLTHSRIRKHHGHVWKSILAVYEFEALLKPPTATPRAPAPAALPDNRVLGDWSTLTQHLRTHARKTLPS